MINFSLSKYFSNKKVGEILQFLDILVCDFLIIAYYFPAISYSLIIYFINAMYESRHKHCFIRLIANIGISFKTEKGIKMFLSWVAYQYNVK